MKFFDTITFLSIFLLLAGSLSAQDCPDFIQNNLVRTTENCQSGIIECLPIEYEFSGEYEYTLNGTPYNGSLSSCGEGTIAAYDVLGIANYPINIDSWEVDGLIFNNIQVNTPNDFADTLTLLSGVQWTFDALDFKIRTTNAPDSLGWLSWTEINTGLTASTLPEFSSDPSQTGFEFPIGNHVFVAYNFLEDCADTLLIDVICQQITDTLVFTILEGESDSIFFDTSNLGQIDYFANECPNQSGAYVDFQTINGANSLYFEGILPGTEQACIVLCDVNGNCDTTYVFVTVDPFISCTDPVIDFVNVIDMDCDEPGSIQLFMQDPNQDYTFNWDNNQPNTDYIFDLAAGTYNVTITSGDSTQQLCMTTASYTVNFIDDIEPYNYSVTPSCSGNNFGTGSATFTNIGLTYTWQDGLVAHERYDLAEGVYEVTVSTNNCEEVTQVFIPGTYLEVTGSVNNVCDSLGSIYLDAVGDFPPFVYYWNDGATTANRFDVAEGIYVVTVTDAYGCTVENAFEVLDDCPPTGCTDPVIDFVNVIDMNCDEPGSIQLFMQDPNQNYTFNWDNNQPNSDYIFDLAAGTYNVTITSGDSTQQLCMTTASYTVNFIDDIEPYNYSVTPSCGGNNFGTGSATFTNIGLTYTWQDGFIGHERYDLAPGVHEVIVSTNNCEEITQVFIPEALLEITGSVNNVCDSLGAIYLDVIGDFPPFTYFWNDGATTVNRFDVAEGIYSVIVTDAFGCTAENTFEVVDDCPGGGCTQPVISNVITVNPSCVDSGAIFIELVDNTVDYTFNWSHGGPNSGSQTGLWPGNFEVTITNIDPMTGEVCDLIADFNLYELDSLDFYLVNSFNATCAAPGFAEFSNQNYIYNWSDGGTGYIRDDLAAGNYTITVTAPNGNCEQVTFLTIQQGSDISLSGFAANVCDTLGSIYLSVSGGTWPYTYQWNNGVTTLSQPELNVGTYTITVTDAVGCTHVQTYTIIDDCPGSTCVTPVITGVTTIDPDCIQLGMIDVQLENITPNTTFLWSDGSDMPSQIIDLEAGFYSVTIFDFDPQTGDTCAVVESFVLTAQDSLVFSLVNLTPAGCNSLGTAEYSDPTLIYNWSDGGFGHIRADLAAGFYEITVSSPNSNCEEVTFLDIPEISDISYNPVVANVCDTLGSIYLFNPNGVYTYQWSNGSINQDQPAVDVGVYTVTVTNAQGCTVSETFEIVDDCSGTGCIEPIIVATDVQNPGCDNLGSILLEVGNFDPNMSYVWSHGGPDSNIQTDLPAGDYEVTITNVDTATGETCFTTASFNLLLTDSLGAFLVNITPAICNSLGTAEYSDPSLIYNWSDGGLGHVRDDLASGSYTVTITNVQQTCVDLSFITILDAGAIDATFTASNVCDTLGSIYMTVNGGSWPYTYDWDDLPGTNNPEDRVSVDVGNYIVTITDALGCQLTLNFVIVDDCPNTGDLIFTFIPGDLDIECGDSAPIETPIAESDCPGDILYDFTETQTPNCGNTSILTRTWVATDDCGNTASAIQTIFENDFEVPVITTIGDITIDLLNGDSLLDPQGFATVTDDCGIVADLSYTKEESITDDGYQVAYTWTALDECGNFASAIHTVDVTGGMIWPGDTDSNKVVNNFDVFNIGFAYGATGPTRMSPTLDFLPQYAAPWSENGLDGVNFRHADTDGNGIVNEQDILAVNLNYDLTHNLQDEGDTRETFDIDFVYETVTADNWVHVAVVLGTTAEPIDDFYGAGFIIEYDQNMVVPNTAHVDFSDSWTGTFFNDFIALQKDFHDEGRLDVGLVRINQQGIDGSGKIGSFRFQLPEGVEFTPFMLTAREGEGVRADKSPYELETTEVIVTNVKDILTPSAIEVYPNPVQTELFLDIPTELEVTNIQLFGTNGQMVKEYTDVATRTLEVNTLPAGLYYLRILTTEGTWTDKVSIIK